MGRAAALSLPIPGQDEGTARTEPSLPQMGPAGAATPETSGAPRERRTTLPTAPVGPVTARSELCCAPPATVPMSLVELGAPEDRRSTGIPVEKAGPRPSSAAAATASRRRLALVMTAGALMLGVGMAGVGWFSAGEAPRPAPGSPLVPSRGSVSTAPAAPESASAVPVRVGPPGARGAGKRRRP